MTRQEASDDALQRYVGRSEALEDVVDEGPAVRLAHTLDLDASALRPGAELPPLWHWIYFLSSAPRHKLGRDGHPVPGDFLPSVGLPRRMWAGGRLRFERPLRIGDRARRVSTIRDVRVTTGRTGRLCFVTVAHDVFCADGLAIGEEQDIVYREDAAPGDRSSAPPAPLDASVSETMRADTTMLFRYSALTFNGHRIHYDREYATRVEGYGGLVVHGPLLATLLAGFAARHSGRPSLRSFSFRAAGPVFDTDPFTINARPREKELAVWVADAHGRLAMSASAVVD